MALVVICGQPCSGKSTAARRLVAALEAVELKPSVRVIDECSLHLGRNQSYVDMTAEKNLRGVLRSEVDRSLSKDNIIIVDSLNNIKGYRYELWCLARAAGIRYCVLYCDTGENYCREWNDKRAENKESSYNNQIFDDLVSRFERPDRRNRWDCPLFELFPSSDEIELSSAVIADAVAYLTKKVDSKTRDIRVLQPTIATQNVRTTEANSLYELDKATQEVISAIVEAQSQALGGCLNKISIGQHFPTISFSLKYINGEDVGVAQLVVGRFAPSLRLTGAAFEPHDTQKGIVAGVPFPLSSKKKKKYINGLLILGNTWHSNFLQIAICFVKYFH